MSNTVYHINFYKALIEDLTKMFWQLFYTNLQVTSNHRHFFTWFWLRYEKISQLS